MNGSNKGKGSIFDKIRNLINATESEDAPTEEEKETDGQMVDINDEKNGYKNTDNRPIMEEIFSDTKKKAKGQKPRPLEHEQGKSGEEKPPVVHLREIKFEEVKKEQLQQDTQNRKETQQAPKVQHEPGEARPQNGQPEKIQEKVSTAAKQKEKTEEKEESPQLQTKKAQEDPQHAQQAGAPARKGEREEKHQKNGVQEKRKKNTQTRQMGATTEDEAADLRQKGEDETLLAKISGKVSALIGFINDKPDEFAPDAGDEEPPQRQADVQEKPAGEPLEIPVQDHYAKKEKTPHTLQKAASLEKEKAGAYSAAKPEEEKKQKSGKDAAAREKQQKEGAEAPAAPFGGFKKMSAQRLPSDQVQKLVVNGMPVPEYIHEKDVNKIILPGDKLQHAIKKEYEEYLKIEIFKEKMQKKAEPEEKQPKPQSKAEPQISQENTHKSLKDRLFGSYKNAAEQSNMPQFYEEKEEPIEDYERPADTRAVRAEINMEARKLLVRSVVTGIAFFLLLGVILLQKNIPAALADFIPNTDIMFCFVNFLLLVLGAAVCHTTVLNGLKPLLSFRGNSDTAAAVAAVAAIAQGILAFFDSAAFFNADKNLYALLVLFALLLNSLGKLSIGRRIRDNFKFISAPNRKYTVKILADEETAEKMLAGTKADKPIIAFQHRTKFLKNFLKLSYTPDPSEKTAAKFAPACMVCAVLVAIIYGIVHQSVPDAVSVLTVVSCMAVPVCCLLSVNIPMRNLCKTAVKNNAMVIGYPAVKHFCDTRAVMVDSRELYPRGRVDLLSVKTFNAYNIDKALMNAAAVLKVANTPMTYMFEDVISDKGEQLPLVESVKYEDGKGLVCWVTGERLLLGTRELMAKYAIDLPSVDFEERNKEDESNHITYLANAGQLVAMLVTSYKADKRIVTELKRLENNGITLLVRTADPNVTQESIARDFRIYFRSVKILPTSLGNICKEQISQKEDSSRAYISTRGKFYSLARAVAGCIKIKNNISIAIVVQFIAVVLGMLLVSTIVITAGLKGLGALELLIYMLFWTAASIIAPMLQKP